MNRKEWALLLALTPLWSGSFFFAKVALAEIGPLTVVLARVAIAAVALILWMAATGRRLPMTRAAWQAFVIMGLLNNVIPQGLISWGMLSIDSGLASILNATTPLCSVLLGHALGREHATLRRLGGVVLGVVGVAVLVGPAALHGRTGLMGQLAVLAAGVSYACAGLYGRRLLAFPPVGASAGMLAGATLALLPIAAVVERPWTFTPGLTTLAALVGLALLSTAAGYVLYFRILATAGPTNLLLVTLTMPVGVLALGTAFLGERPSGASLVGMALIFFGLAIIDGRLRGVRIFGHSHATQGVGRSRTEC